MIFDEERQSGRPFTVFALMVLSVIRDERKVNFGALREATISIRAIATECLESLWSEVDRVARYRASYHLSSLGARLQRNGSCARVREAKRNR